MRRSCGRLGLALRAWRGAGWLSIRASMASRCRVRRRPGSRSSCRCTCTPSTSPLGRERLEEDVMTFAGIAAETRRLVLRRRVRRPSWAGSTPARPRDADHLEGRQAPATVHRSRPWWCQHTQQLASLQAAGSAVACPRRAACARRRRRPPQRPLLPRRAKQPSGGQRPIRIRLTVCRQSGSTTNVGPQPRTKFSWTCTIPTRGGVSRVIQHRRTLPPLSWSGSSGSPPGQIEWTPFTATARSTQRRRTTSCN